MFIFFTRVSLSARLKTQDVKMTDRQNHAAWKCKTWKWRTKNDGRENTLCLNYLLTFFSFCYYSVKFWPIVIVFGIVAAEKICKQTTDSFAIIFSLCTNITQ